MQRSNRAEWHKTKKQFLLTMESDMNERYISIIILLTVKQNTSVLWEVLLYRKKKTQNKPLPIISMYYHLEIFLLYQQLYPLQEHFSVSASGNTDARYFWHIRHPQMEL